MILVKVRVMLDVFLTEGLRTVLRRVVCLMLIQYVLGPPSEAPKNPAFKPGCLFK